MNQKAELKRKESKFEVQTYLDKLKHSINSGSVKINFQGNRLVDKSRDEKYSNRFTLGKLFPDEDDIVVLKRELLLLTIDEYIETIKDTKFPKRSEMRVFGKQYGGDDVYIKIRVELVNITHASGGSFILVMSFHYSTREFTENDFPFKKVENRKNE